MHLLTICRSELVGEKLKEDFLPYGKQWIDDDDIKAVSEVLASDWLTTGPKVKEFEERLAETTGADFAVVLNSGTAALHAAYFAGGIKDGDEIITSPLTFAATANAALYLGAKPCFADVEYNMGNIDPLQAEKAITAKTKAIVPVDFAGHPAELEEIKRIALKNDLLVIEDAAHALGATCRGKKVGSISDMTTFSFHPLKHITTGEGGAVTTNNRTYYEKIIRFRSHGFSVDKKPDLWRREMLQLGYNYRLTDLQSALGISQLKKLGLFIARRRQIAKEYNERLSALTAYLELPAEKDSVVSAHHLYVIKVKQGQEERKKLFTYLHTKRIGTQVHYLPIYQHPYYQKLGYKKGLCPQAEKFYARAISLPLFARMTSSDVKRVCKELEAFFCGVNQ